MKIKKVTLFLSIVLFTTTLLAQDDDKKELEVELDALKKEYIQTKLDLSDTKLNEFTTLYEKYEEEKKELKKQARESRKEVNSKKRMSTEELEELKEEEALLILSSKLKQQEAMLELEKSYIQQFTSTLSAKQVLQYQQAEKEFRRDLLKAAMEERKENSRDIQKKMRSQMKKMREMRDAKEIKESR